MFLIVDEYPSNTAGRQGNVGCFTCGAPKRDHTELLVDLGVNVDEVIGLDGEVYGFKKPIMCATCIAELVGVIGGLGPTEGQRLLGANQTMSAMIEEYANMEMDYEALKTQIAKVRVP